MSVSINPEHFKPGQFELFCGPMYSGKTEALAYRLRPVLHLPNINFAFFRPAIDNRPDRTCPFETTFIEEVSPEKILDLLHIRGLDNLVVGIDEIEFFSPRIIRVVEELLRNQVNVIAGGLDLDFRGEFFGPMGQLISMADYVHKCRQAVCKYNDCGRTATRTQRLINGNPAHYTSPIISVEGSKTTETYEPRCIEHHFVPGKPE
ncbi:thymidine kinase [Candidatus Pacearchaeota archaeon]|nr:thymidine kinase [Candidatus Pacearchaeota archaeon]